jgi:acetylornithine deacetylase/succinyl-diaminopimelate desuccinylase-like protein
VIRRARSLAALALLLGGAAQADIDPATRQLAHDVFKQLIEINTTDSVGSVTAASEAMAARLREAGFADSDIHILGPTDRTKNLVVRLRGTGKRKPVLLIGHLDVVEARREDWTTDPFQFIEKDGYYYGRGTQDMKNEDAALVTTLIRLKKEHYRPDRDIIVALTAGEESGLNNGVEWLVENHRELIDAEFALNEDDTGVYTEHGKPVVVQIEAAEKIYADFELTVTNPGGHSSIPRKANAIYQLTAGLDRLAQYEFPFELNDVTRTYYSRVVKSVTGQRASDIQAILQTPPDANAIARLSEDRMYNAMMRTTCVATRFDAGHANNALPQMARAIVNCRVLPGHAAEETRLKLIEVLADPTIVVRYIDSDGVVHDTAESKHGVAPLALRADVVKSVEKIAAQMWPGAPVVPTMGLGASDLVYVSQLGIGTYLVSGQAMEREDDRMHGKDERIEVEAFYRAVDFHYRFLKTLLAQH